MDQEPSPDSAAAKRERIKAISRTVHSIPVEEGGQLRPPRPAPAPAPPARSWAAIAAGGVGVLSLGFLAGLLASRRGA
ncbi:hypothetical protein V6R86_02010 [Sphingomonas kaistensis]|uniref:DUF3618 domain-containing protein n=1 Tax=Sphingomonas kaistensis TaxID=298708 RepID=A0ABZ2FXE2_9SPHN